MADDSTLPPLPDDFDVDKALGEMRWIESYKAWRRIAMNTAEAVQLGGTPAYLHLVQRLHELDREQLKWLALASLTDLRFDSADS